jgi:predicted Zn-dependent peptidase
MRIIWFSVLTSELTNAKQYLKGGMCLAAESTENQMIRIAQNEMNFGRFVPLEEIEAEIDKVSTEDVEALAGDMFRKESAALTLLGPVGESVPYEDILAF